MGRIEVFADISCPFTHVGLKRLIDALRTAGSQERVRIRAWPLEWINGAPLSSELVRRETAALRASVSSELFKEFDGTTYPFTSIPAFGLVAAGYAIDEAKGEAVSLAVRDALFEAGMDVADPSVLRAIGQQLNVEPLELAQAESAVRADWELGKARGVQGSPHFFVGERGWFCPSLEISHEGERFDVQIAEETMHDFYAAALGFEATSRGAS